MPIGNPFGHCWTLSECPISTSTKVKQMETFKVNENTSNAKLGKGTASTMTDEASCPTSCPLKGKGCYAELGPTSWHWKKVKPKTNGVLERGELMRWIKALPNGKLLRHNVAGDLPHLNGTIDAGFVRDFARAAKGKTAFTYTHHVPTPANVKTIKEANRNGFTINLSANALSEVDGLLATGLPVATLLPIDAPKVQKTEGGARVIACPADANKKITCDKCRLCTNADRDFVIGFRAHGAKKKTVDLISRV